MYLLKIGMQRWTNQRKPLVKHLLLGGESSCLL